MGAGVLLIVEGSFTCYTGIGNLAIVLEQIYLGRVDVLW
jgi:hypothetical protein